ITAKISYDTGAGTIDYIGGWRHLNQGYINEYNANATNKYAGYIIVDNGTNDEWSQEVKYNTSLFDDRVKLTTGAFYMQEISNDRSTTFTGGTTSFNPTGDTIYRFKAQTAAYYAQGDIKLTDALTLTLGGRYTWEEKTLHFTPSSQFSGLGFGDTQVQSYGIPLKLTTNRFTPRVAVSYKVTPAIMLFASATNGFKSGGWNALITKASQALSFRPEKTWSYEAGFKSDWFDHKLRLNVTGYLANTDDLQASAAILVQGTTASLSFNAGTQRVYGVEVESSAKLGNLTLFANPSFMHGEYTYISPQALTLSTSLSPVRTPTFQFSGGATYEKPVEAIKGSLGATLAYRHNSSYWVSVLNTTHTLTEDYLDLGAYYRTSDDRLTVGVDVTNLFNQTTVTANFLSLFPGDPRRVTARVKLKI
ncbi:MAG TPA: TonB-dependent receptor, partial [Novosphingobium sp.]|nr:TonB-dependent receptor [Novosphingobium sp.]